MHSKKNLASSLALISLIVGTIFATPTAAQAAVTYNPNNILSDAIFRSHQSMSVTNIQAFLNAKNSGLAALQFTFGGGIKSVAQLVADAATAYGISPKVLLTMMQKEQGAIEDPTLSEEQMRHLMGFGVNDPSYEGVPTQIDRAARQLQRYTLYPTKYNFQIGKERVTQDGVTVKPENQSTANLFIYNPVAGNTPGATASEIGHGGNFLFWKLWLRYFATKYPDGILVQAKGQSGVYLLKNGQRFAFWSKKVFSESYSNTPIVRVEANELDAYPIVGPVKFNDGTLIRAKNGGVFVITNGMKKPIPSSTAFKLLGYVGKRIVDVDDIELKIHPQTTKFDANHLVRQNGALLKIKENPGVYLIENGTKRPVWSSYIKATRFQNVPVIDASQAELDQYKLGRPVEFRDGTIIRDPENNLFVISKGKRYAIDNKAVLDELNMGSLPVVAVSASVRNAHPLAGNLSSYGN